MKRPDVDKGGRQKPQRGGSNAFDIWSLQTNSDLL